MIPSDFVVFLNPMDYSKLTKEEISSLASEGTDVRNSYCYFDPEPGIAKAVLKKDLEGLINANRSD